MYKARFQSITPRLQYYLAGKPSALQMFSFLSRDDFQLLSNHPAHTHLVAANREHGP